MWWKGMSMGDDRVTAQNTGLSLADRLNLGSGRGSGPATARKSALNTMRGIQEDQEGVEEEQAKLAESVTRALVGNKRVEPVN